MSVFNISMRYLSIEVRIMMISSNKNIMLWDIEVFMFREIERLFFVHKPDVSMSQVLFM